jgi:hypothetical protein
LIELFDSQFVERNNVVAKLRVGGGSSWWCDKLYFEENAKFENWEFER